MTYSRHDFLRIAVAGLPVVTGVPWLLTGAAQADRIHNRSTEAAIRQAGKNPEEVKAQVNRRLRELRTGSAG